MAEARFDYPAGAGFDLVVNVIDQLDVVYTSQWAKLNFTVFCQQSTASNGYFVHDADTNPILGSGIYTVPSIQSLGYVTTQYPVDCHCMLTQYGNTTNAVNGAGFRLTSTAGAARTLQQSQTSSSPTYSTQTAAATGVVVSTSSQVTISTSPTATFSSAPSATTISSSNLSSSAAAGIGVGATLGVILIGAIGGYWIWSKKRPKWNALTKQRRTAGDYDEHARSNTKEYFKSELPASGTVQAVRTVHESDSRPLEPQVLMAREHTLYSASDGRAHAELP